MLVAIGVTAFNLAGRYLPIFETEDPERTKIWARENKRLAGLEFSRASSAPDPR